MSYNFNSYNMKELFLNYEDSLLMKEKGFDEECLAFHYHLLSRPEFDELIIYKGYYEFTEEATCTNTSLGSTYVFAAPLYSQAIQWILEKLEDKYTTVVKITLYTDGSGRWGLFSKNMYFNNPSECVREGLNLI